MTVPGSAIYILAPAIAGLFALPACDQVRGVVQAVAPPSTLTGTYIEKEHGRAMRARWIESGGDPGDMTEVLEFRSDQTVERTFLHRPTTGTYTLEGNLVKVTINSKDPETHQWQTYARAFTRERNDLMDEDGNLLVHQTESTVQ